MTTATHGLPAGIDDAIRTAIERYEPPAADPESGKREAIRKVATRVLATMPEPYTARAIVDVTTDVLTSVGASIGDLPVDTIVRGVVTRGSKTTGDYATTADGTRGRRAVLYVRLPEPGSDEPADSNGRAVEPGDVE